MLCFFIINRLAECCFTSTETVGLLGTGAQDVHLDLHTAPELCIINSVLLNLLFVCSLHHVVSCRNSSARPAVIVVLKMSIYAVLGVQKM